MDKFISIKGARVHNLKNIDVQIPRDKLVVLTGLSGSGKSSLAFDTIYAEGQRRYMESLSSYARQFLGQMDKPDVDYIDGLSPAISIDQKTTSHNPRSTVGTVTEIYDYLRLLYARVGIPHCPKCGREIVQQSVDQIADKVTSAEKGSKIRIFAPVVRGRKGEYSKQIDGYRKSGYSRLIVDGSEYNILDEEIELDKNYKHSIKIVVDRLVLKDDVNRRLTDSLEAALKLAEGLVEVEVNGDITLYSTKYSCPDCDISIEELQPRMFSFNSPFGACPECLGLGFKSALDINKLVKWDKSVADGALDVSGWNMDTGNYSTATFMALAKRHKFSLQTPVRELPEKIVDILLYGDEEKLQISYNTAMGSGVFNRNFEGVANNIMRRFRETSSDYVKQELSKLMREVPCDSCRGKRLKKEVLGVTVGGKNINEVCNLSIDKALKFFEELTLTPTQQLIAAQILKEIRSRLGFLVNVGLNYLQLAR